MCSQVQRLGLESGLIPFKKLRMKPVACLLLQCFAYSEQ